MATKKEDTQEDEPAGGIEIVPLFELSLKKVAQPYGDQYVSGKISSKGRTFPGVPVCVKSWRYVHDQLLVAHTSSGAFLGCLPENMTLDKLQKTYRKKFGNPERWRNASPKP